jgi:2-polyprenyl-3-methyl-5-hydroxy-6-metoxy-1,4-benzoquinol methylase
MSESERRCPVCGKPELQPRLRKGSWIYLRCEHCRLLALHPLPTPAQINSHYRSKFAHGNYELIQRYAPEYQRVHEGIANLIEIDDGERVLDVGCFTGDLLQVLAARGADVYGLELQPEAVEIANKQLREERVFQADVVSSEFPPGPYDVITMMGLIEHVLEPRTLIKSARKLLSSGGRLYLQTPNSDSVLARVMGSIWPPLAPIEHIYLFGARAMRALLQQEGFGKVRVRPHIKRLPVAYVYEQFANFGGPGWQLAAAPARRLLGGTRLPFYGGEMFVSARLPSIDP